jgi:uncharacterized protein YcaQ
MHLSNQTSMHSLPLVTAADARTLLLDAQGLLVDPARRAGPKAVQKTVEQLGFVQVDSIQKIERAHHLILGARLDDYRAKHLDEIAFDKRMLFEHWTHDASMIPTEWFHHWKPRFIKTDSRLRKSRWFTHRLGATPEQTLAQVYERIQREGPLRISDFERSTAKPTTGWWDWTPEKTALEFLWHTGRLSIHGRDRFQKIYELTERVFPAIHAKESPQEDAHIDWACRSALERLGVATPGELAAFWNAITIAQAATWCRNEIAAERIAAVQVESLQDTKPRAAFALLDWKRRVRRAVDAPDRIRLLAPFDPVIRDRKRALRLFSFDYSFEAFVPAKKRKYGYYVLPILEGDRLVGRLDPRHEREQQALVVDSVWWEKGVKPTRERQRKLNDALAVLAMQIGAKTVTMNLNRGVK